MIKNRKAKGGGAALSDAIFRGLALFKYVRMIILLGVLAGSAGLLYYAYTRSVYEARGAVKYDLFRYAVQDENIGANNVGSYIPIMREMLTQLRSQYLLKLTAEEMGLATHDQTYMDIRSSLIPIVRVENLSDGLLNIYVQAFRADVARDFPEALVRTYNKYQSQVRREQRDQLLNTYQQELKELSDRLDKSFDQTADYERESAMIETFIQQNQLTQVPRDMIVAKHRLSKMEQVRETFAKEDLDTISKLSLLSAFNKEPLLEVGNLVPKQDKGPLGGPPPGAVRVVEPAMLNSLEPWEELEKEQRQLKEDIKRLSDTYLPGHARMKALQDRLEEVNRGLENELVMATQRFDLEQRKLQDQLAKLQAQLPEYRQVIRNYDGFLQKYGLLQTEKDAWDAAYRKLQERIKAIDFEGDRGKVNLRFDGLIGYSDAPISPNKRKLLMSSLVLGLALGLGIPFLLEMFNDSTSRIEDLEAKINLKGLGIVPVTEPLKLESIVREPEAEARLPDSLLENFRIIRSGIILDQEKGPSQVIMVGSARPSEGKTVVSANLAWAFSSMGDKTLIIDADLRRGRQHKVLDLPNTVGLSSVLMGKAALNDAIQSTAVAGMDFLARGPIIPGSTEKLCNTDFEDLIAECRHRYQRIIVDTPPVLGLSETTSLQKVVDGIVLVVRAEQTPTRLVRDAVQTLSKAGGHFYGFVLNRLDLSSLPNYYNYYYYSPNYYTDYGEKSEA